VADRAAYGTSGAPDFAARKERAGARTFLLRAAKSAPPLAGTAGRLLNLASEFVDDSAIAGEHWFSLALSIAANAFLVWGLVELGLMRGMTGVNRYGDDPLAPSHSGRPGLD
jgi:hypothetical protein